MGPHSVTPLLSELLYNDTVICVELRKSQFNYLFLSRFGVVGVSVVVVGGVGGGAAGVVVVCYW